MSCKSTVSFCSRQLSLYYECSSGSPVLRQCPTGTYFDCMRQQCGTSPIFDFCCQSNYYYENLTFIYDFGYLPNLASYPCENGVTSSSSYENDFSVYIKCVNNRIFIGDCGSEIFCNISQTCYNPNTQVCDESLVSTYTTPDYSPYATKPMPNCVENNSGICPNNAPLPVIDDCTAYYDCSTVLHI